MSRYRPHKNGRDSGVEWLGSVPDSWQVVKAKTLVTACQNGLWGQEPKGDGADTLCIRVADFDRNQMTVVEAPATRRFVTQDEKTSRLVTRGDLLMEKSGGGESTSVGAVVRNLGDEDAICSNFVAVVRLKQTVNSNWATYLFASMYSSGLNCRSIKQTTGIQNIDSSQYLDELVTVPPSEEQAIIAATLDRETTRIDALIAKKSRFIELLKEKRQALITHAVTKGLDPTVKMKDSGVEWIGEVPEHWTVLAAKRLFRERDERSVHGDEEMMTVSHLTGVTPRSEKNVSMFEAETTEGYKICRPGDLAINTLWAWMGAMGTARQLGIVSPAYNIYTPNDRLEPQFVDLLVRMPMFAKEVTRFSKGIRESRLRLYPEGFFEVQFAVPPIHEQCFIISRVRDKAAQIESLAAKTQLSIDLLKERRSALITAVVTGQIDLREAA